MTQQHDDRRAPQDPQSALIEALAYASRGWPVFPLHTPAIPGCSCGKLDCAHPGKHPRTQHGQLDATSDEAIIRRWWAKWPEANIGIAMGVASGLATLDIDPRHGGDETWAEWEREHGPLPSTVEVCTGGGGRHIYFSHPGGQVKSRAIAPGIEVKADGGYVVAPPSLHGSGQCYAWELSSHPDDTPLAPMPDWLLAFVASHPEEPTPKPAEAAPTLREGERNTGLTGLAGGMRRIGLDQDEILAALRQINQSRCQPQLGDREVAGIALSISRYAPGAVPRPGVGSSSSSSLMTVA